MRRRALAFVVPLAIVTVLSFSDAAAAPGGHHGHHGGRPLSAVLWGANESPFAGDSDGSGTATLRLNPGHGEICFRIRVSGITLPATAANVYQGTAGVTGVFAVSLLAPTTTGSSEGCVVASRGTLLGMMWNPSAYYVNVFTSDFQNERCEVSSRRVGVRAEQRRAEPYSRTSGESARRHSRVTRTGPVQQRSPCRRH